MNPDEMVWRQVKQHSVQRNLYDSCNALKDAVFKAMYCLQKSKNIIESFFTTPLTAYATCK